MVVVKIVGNNGKGSERRFRPEVVVSGKPFGFLSKFYSLGFMPKAKALEIAEPVAKELGVKVEVVGE